MKYKRIFCYLLAVAIFFTLSPTSFAISSQSDEVSSTLTETADFVDNRVLVVLNNSASLALNNYDEFYFPEIECKSISNFNCSI